jgi:hypothetical protein
LDGDLTFDGVVPLKLSLQGLFVRFRVLLRLSDCRFDKLGFVPACKLRQAAYPSEPPPIKRGRRLEAPPPLRKSP